MTRVADHPLPARAALTLLAGSLVAGLLVPVYTDEVGWRFQLSRWFQDGGIDHSVGESCGPNAAAVAPWTMLPVRWFSSAMTALFDDPAWVRLAGVATALGALFAMRAIVRRAAGGARPPIELLLWSLLGLGVLPFLLVWSRPEQPLLLAILGALFLGVRRPGRATSWPAAAIVALFLIAVSYHPKGLFYLPVFAVALIVREGRRWPRAVAATALLVLAAVAYGYWSARFACPDDPIMAARLQRENAAPLLLAGGWRGVLAAVPTLIANASPAAYLKAALPAPQYMSDWLPGATLPAGVIALWFAAGWFAWCAALLGAAVATASALRRTPAAPALLLAGALLASLCVTAGLQTTKNAYESALYLPVLALAAALVLTLRPAGRRVGGLALGLGLLAALSQFLLLAHYVPRLWPTTAGGYVADQPFSLAAWRYPRARVVAAGRACGIAPGAASVLVDDLTYFAYAHGPAPLHRLGVFGPWQGKITDPLAWMRRRGSPGAVLACRYLPRALRGTAVRTGEFCCVRTP